MKKLSKRERSLLIVFLGILLLSIGTEFLLFPSLDKASLLKEERALLQQQWKEVESYAESEDILTTQIALLKKQNEELSQQLPSSQSSHLYWEFLNKSAEQAGVSLSLMKEERSEESTGSIIELQVTGEFSETTAFLQKVYAMPYIHAISTAAFQRGEASTSTLSLYISNY